MGSGEAENIIAEARSRLLTTLIVTHNNAESIENCSASKSLVVKSQLHAESLLGLNRDRKA